MYYKKDVFFPLQLNNKPQDRVHKCVSMDAILIVPDTVFLYTRGWMQMVFYYHMIYSPETDRQIKHRSWLHHQGYNRLMHTMKRTLCIKEPWYCAEPVFFVFYHLENVSLPPLSGTNCSLLPPPGGPGPPSAPTFKMAPFSPGSTHIFVPMSVTLMSEISNQNKRSFDNREICNDEAKQTKLA
jgi:hypothetical protein